MVSDIVPRAPVCTMLDVGASGSFTVVDEVSGGLLVELEDGRRFVWRWEDGLSSGGGRGLSRTMPAWIQRTRLPEGSLNGAGRGQSHASASAPSLPDGWEGFIDPVTKLSGGGTRPLAGAFRAGGDVASLKLEVERRHDAKASDE
eukprot:CAMPEP_0171061400 /NCGR_PEP_ID=MMETSP0766_2-20121228/4410_1 /TAXON_ID=439317 /ORGANISM="Gambierdiscus australes, Strain CAWD 149" /LENGTH=144 /DNA_ID=CAMNT_0011517081 /DNA_START=24 /DNA_END=459 /DNA_ORIENTATION=+